MSARRDSANGSASLSSDLGARKSTRIPRDSGDEREPAAAPVRPASQGADAVALLLARAAIRLLIARNSGQPAESAPSGPDSVSVDLLNSASEVMNRQRVNAYSRPKEAL